MTLHHDIGKLVSRLSPEPICDTCITRTLGLSAQENVEHAARELLGGHGFERRKDTCSLCGETGLVTRQR